MTPGPSSSITPTGSWPMINPGRTGYSPCKMCTSVPQIVVRVTRITASPIPALGRGTSSTRMSLTPWNTVAFIILTPARVSLRSRVSNAVVMETSSFLPAFKLSRMRRKADTGEGGGEAGAGREGTTRRGGASGVGALRVDPGAIEIGGVERVEVFVRGQEVGSRGDGGRGDPDVVLLNGIAATDQISVDLSVGLQDLIGNPHDHEISKQLFQDASLPRAPVSSLDQGQHLSKSDDGDQRPFHPCV